MSVNLLTKKNAIERLKYINSLNYTDSEYMRAMRKHMLKYRQNAKGLINNRLSANQELVMFESYGFVGLKNYAVDVIEHNIEYCEVLECDNHNDQIEKTIQYLKNTCSVEYLLKLKPYSKKNANIWYIPVERLVNWIDCYMIQKDVFFKYSTNEEPYLFVPNYFTDNVLLMTVKTDNEEEDYNNDINIIFNVYKILIDGICQILKQLPEDKMIDDLFTITNDKLKENGQYIQQLAKEYMEMIENME